jgi:hypothetical protein
MPRAGFEPAIPVTKTPRPKVNAEIDTNYNMKTSFHILSHSSFTYNPLIRSYEVWITEKAQLN